MKIPYEDLYEYTQFLIRELDGLRESLPSDRDIEMLWYASWKNLTELAEVLEPYATKKGRAPSRTEH